MCLNYGLKMCEDLKRDVHGRARKNDHIALWDRGQPPTCPTFHSISRIFAKHKRIWDFRDFLSVSTAVEHYLFVFFG